MKPVGVCPCGYPNIIITSTHHKKDNRYSISSLSDEEYQWFALPLNLQF